MESNNSNGRAAVSGVGIASTAFALSLILLAGCAKNSAATQPTPPAARGPTPQSASQPATPQSAQQPAQQPASAAAPAPAKEPAKEPASESAGSLAEKRQAAASAELPGPSPADSAYYQYLAVEKAIYQRVDCRIGEYADNEISDDSSCYVVCKPRGFLDSASGARKRQRVEGWENLRTSAQHALGLQTPTADGSPNAYAKHLTAILSCTEKYAAEDKAIFQKIESAEQTFDAALGEVLKACAPEGSDEFTCKNDTDFAAYGRHLPAYQRFIAIASSSKFQERREKLHPKAVETMEAQVASLKMEMKRNETKLLDDATKLAADVNAAAINACHNGNVQIKSMKFTDAYFRTSAGFEDAQRVVNSMQAFRSLLASDADASLVCSKLDPAGAFAFAYDDQPNRTVNLRPDARPESARFWYDDLNTYQFIARDQTADQIRAFLKRLPDQKDVKEAAKLMAENASVSCAIPDDADGSEIERFKGCLEGYRLVAEAANTKPRILPTVWKVSIGKAGSGSCPVDGAPPSVVITPDRNETSQILSKCGRAQELEKFSKIASEAPRPMI